MIKQDEKYIRRCIQIAKNGLGTTYPNPLVGSVIVYNNQIIGEGWHKKAGQAHAEINAIASVRDKNLLKDSDIYVSLEPCSHYGQTPPCAMKIAELQFKRVIIGITDPNLKVNGKGISIIQKSGIPTTVGILENECRNLNKRFFTYHIKKRPYIFLKWAETINKKIDNGNDRNSPFWISNPYSLQKTHLMRSQEEAILIGKNTALIDNPSLTCRSVQGDNPLRILIDRRLDVPESFRLYNLEAHTLIFNEKMNLKKEQSEYIQIDFSKNIFTQITNELYLRNIQSIIIEGGRKTLQNFIDNSLWDEAIITTSNTIVKKGTDSPSLWGKITHQEYIDTNLITYIQNIDC